MHESLQSMAQRALESAKVHTVENHAAALRYGALELRKALVFVAYERLLQYKDQISPKDYETWEPQYVVRLLGEIDPDGKLAESAFSSVDEGASPSPGDGPPSGDPTNADLVDRYEALTQFVRAPTLEQMLAREVWTESDLKAECEAAIAFVEKVFSTSDTRKAPAVFASFGCARCKKLVVRRVRPEAIDEVTARCVECGACYTARKDESGKVDWIADVTTIPCGTEGCEYQVNLWPEQLRPGVNWTCPGCNARWVIYMGWAKLDRAERTAGEDPSDESNARAG